MDFTFKEGLHRTNISRVQFFHSFKRIVEGLYWKWVTNMWFCSRRQPFLCKIAHWCPCAFQCRLCRIGWSHCAVLQSIGDFLSFVVKKWVQLGVNQSVAFVIWPSGTLHNFKFFESDAHISQYGGKWDGGSFIAENSHGRTMVRISFRTYVFLERNPKCPWAFRIWNELGEIIPTCEWISNGFFRFVTHLLEAKIDPKISLHMFFTLKLHCRKNRLDATHILYWKDTR